LPKAFNICSREDFEGFKCRVESGEIPFVCQHCQDQSTCPGPQCQKRWKNRAFKSVAGDYCGVHEAMIVKKDEFADFGGNHSPIAASQPMAIPLPKLESFGNAFPIEQKKPGLSYSFSETFAHGLSSMPHLSRDRAASWDGGKSAKIVNDQTERLAALGLQPPSLETFKSNELFPEIKRKTSLDNVSEFGSTPMYPQAIQLDDRIKRVRLEQPLEHFASQQTAYERLNMQSQLIGSSQKQKKTIKAGNWNISKGRYISGFDFDGLDIEDDVHFSDFSESPFYSKSRLTTPCASSAPLPDSFTRTPFSKNIKTMLSENSGRTEEDLESVHSLHDIVLSRDPISEVILSDLDPPQSLFFSAVE
jgi:hypothetical protein